MGVGRKPSWHVVLECERCLDFCSLLGAIVLMIPELNLEEELPSGGEVWAWGELRGFKE